MINVGIIGCGKIAQIRHIPEYEANPNARIAGLFDLNRDRAQELAKKLGAKAYSSCEELLADASIDAVSVCVANVAHASTTIDALRAGKSVLCEKPMAVTLQECEAMVEAADREGKLLMIGQNQRLTGAHRRAKELIAQGEIGEILSFRTTFGHAGPETWSIDSSASTWFFDPKRAVMGAMADLGVHKTDLIQYLTGQRIVETTARIFTIDKRDASNALIRVDDNAICIYRLEGGATGTMTASWTYYGAEDNSTVFYGTKGIMRIYADPNYSIVIEKRNGERVLYAIDAIQTNANQTSTGVIDAFVEALVSGDYSRAIEGRDVLHAMRVVFANLESAANNRTVRVPC